jgi:hypothetical protein
MYHFLSGFTAKVAGTEKGLGKEPQPTFSTCFGAPFMPRHPTEYGNLLRDLIAQHKADCWLVNTGWTGGAFGTGSRMPIKATRALLAAALDGSLANVEMRIDPHFKFRVPVAVPGVDSKILNPRDTWADKAAYDAQARKLVGMFRDNFKKFEAHVGADVSNSPDLVTSIHPHPRRWQVQHDEGGTLHAGALRRRNRRLQSVGELDVRRAGREIIEDVFDQRVATLGRMVEQRQAGDDRGEALASREPQCAGEIEGVATDHADAGKARGDQTRRIPDRIRWP